VGEEISARSARAQHNQARCTFYGDVGRGKSPGRRLELYRWTKQVAREAAGGWCQPVVVPIGPALYIAYSAAVLIEFRTCGTHPESNGLRLQFKIHVH
jgi:hypothetical protein